MKFLHPDKWTEECPWYQRACIHSYRWLWRQYDRLPWRVIAELRRLRGIDFRSWQRALARIRDQEAMLKQALGIQERLAKRSQEIEQRFMWLRAQVMNLRVAQATPPRTGWEVMAYIPEEVVKKITEWQEKDPDLFEGFMFNVARPLVRNAIKGLVHVNAQGKVNALVFEPLDLREEPRAPKWVMALYETPEGKMRFSDRAKIIDPGTAEERAKRASGL